MRIHDKTFDFQNVSGFLKSFSKSTFLVIDIDLGLWGEEVAREVDTG